MPCEVVLYRVYFFKMVAVAAVAMETAKINVESSLYNLYGPQL
jgi:hypothetical protein